MLLCAIGFMFNSVWPRKHWLSRHFHQLCGKYSHSLLSFKQKCDFFIHTWTIPYSLAGATWFFNMVTIPIRLMLNENLHPEWALLYLTAAQLTSAICSPRVSWRFLTVWIMLLFLFCHPRDMIHSCILGSLTRLFLSCVSQGKNRAWKSVQWNSVSSFSCICYVVGREAPLWHRSKRQMNLFSFRFSLISNHFSCKITVS